LGYSRMELEGGSIRSINPDGSLLQGHVLNSSDLVLLHRNGSTLYVDATFSSVVLHGRVNVLIMLRDVTERHQVLAAKLVHEERVRQVMAINRCAINLSVQELCDRFLAIAQTITSSRTGFLYLSNDQLNALVLISWSSEVGQLGHFQQVPRSLLDPAEAWTDVVQQMQPVLCNDPVTVEGQLPMTRFLGVPVLSQGKVKLVLVVANKLEPYHEEDRRQLQSMGDDALNLILRKQLEETLRQGKEQAESAHQVKAAFLASMSHEIRTPMNGVLGMADLILRTSLTEQQRHYVNTIHRSGRTLLRIINDILDLSKIQAGRLELELFRFDLDELIRDVYNLFTSQAHGKGLDLICTMADGVPVHLLGDPYRLNQVLFNLIGNAIKFTREGSVTLMVDVMEEREADVLVRFQVIDTGIGIAPEYLPNLFQPFSQADSSIARKFGGSGLGLTIARQLVQVMDGELWLDSQLDQGTKFSFVVRFGKQQAGDREVMSEWEAKKTTSLQQDIQFDGHVLLVEDNLVNQEVAEATLGLLGLKVTVAHNGQQALTMVQQADIPFDAIFMDCEMPILDGFETTRRLRVWEQQTGWPRIPIIALTAHVLKESRRLSLEAGMDDYLHKPFSQSDLTRALQRWLPPGNQSVNKDHHDSPTGAPQQDDLSTCTVLDPVALNQIVALAQKGNPDLLSRMVEHYCIQTPLLLADLQQALEQGNFEGVRVAAHTLKSSSLTMGATRMAELGRTMEAKYSDPTMVSEYRQSCGQEFEMARQALNDFLQAQPIQVDG
ncbi:MAG: response regulator, partial [Magnetococcales bacterium]|nr:response regulator [Magnetococcales bacterium]